MTCCLIRVQEEFNVISKKIIEARTLVRIPDQGQMSTLVRLRGGCAVIHLEFSGYYIVCCGTFLFVGVAVITPFSGISQNLMCMCTP